MSTEHQEMRRRLQEARVARLGTIAPDGRPHLVPCVFVFEGDTIYTPIDHKQAHTASSASGTSGPTRTRRCRWTTTGRVGTSAGACGCGARRILQGGDEFEDARGLLMARYQQYTDAAQIGPAIRIDEWVGWQAMG
jgi:hypothetical protein